MRAPRFVAILAAVVLAALFRVPAAAAEEPAAADGGQATALDAGSLPSPDAGPAEVPRDEDGGPSGVDAGGLTPPSIVTRADAVYPAQALAGRLDATVDVEAVVDEHGAVMRARAVTPQGHGFDEAALDAVRRSVFAPARSNGQPITSVVDVTYEFHPPPLPAAPPPTPEPTAVAPAAGPPAEAPVQKGSDQRTLVVAKRTYAASLGEPESAAASDSSTGRTELSLRPHLRAESLLEAVPALFTVQHAGGGKAQQYFMRGFDLDHGTDIAFFVDGAPVNAVSHAHGQGYSDLHFIIPEVVESLESTKGPYSARVGDFATAGSVSFHMADSLRESVARLEIGPDNHRRGVVAYSPDLGPAWRAVLAAEVFDEDGPFIHPEGYNRFNGYAKVTRVLDGESTLSLMLSAYGGTWNMSGLLPARAVCGEGDGTPVPAAYAGSRCLSRWDSIDPSQGGAAQRLMALASYRRQIERGDVEATVYAVRSNLQLFLNDGIASADQPEGTLYGSQHEQDDARTQVGGNLRVSRAFDAGPLAVRATAGLQIRDDAVDGQLHRTEQRQRLDGMPGIPGPMFEGAIDESELGAYGELDSHLTSWLRLLIGARVDRVDATLGNESSTAVYPTSGYKGATRVSPKATLEVSPFAALDLFVNFGQGFHTNDVRSTLVGDVDGVQPALIAAATGYEIGATVRPLPGLSLSAVAFLLDLTEELTVDGDTDTTSPTGPTRRYGGEFTGRYQLGHGLYADATFTVSHARYTDAADVSSGNVFVPLAPTRTFGAGVGAREPVGPVTLVGSAYVRSMADRPATPDDSLTAAGYTIVNAQLGVRWRFIEVGADVLNLTNTKWREGQFAVDSRLPGEGPRPATGVSFTPGEPREVIAHAMVTW